MPSPLFHGAISDGDPNWRITEMQLPGRTRRVCMKGEKSVINVEKRCVGQKNVGPFVNSGIPDLEQWHRVVHLFSFVLALLPSEQNLACSPLPMLSHAMPYSRLPYPTTPRIPLRGWKMHESEWLKNKNDRAMRGSAAFRRR